MKIAARDLHFDRCWRLCLPLVLISFASVGVLAQCSQETRPEMMAPPSQLPGQNGATAAPSEVLSSSQAPLRFGTGSAVTVLEETPLLVMNDMPISSRTTKAGDKIAFTVTRDVIVKGILVIPCGATAYGTVVAAKQAGRLVGASSLTLQLTALNLDGRSYPLYTPPFKVMGVSKTAPTVKKAAIGAGVGALAGEAMAPWGGYGIVNGQKVPRRISAGDQAKADAVVAGVGAGVGTAIAATSPPSIALIPAESQIEFTLASPIAVYPVDQRTAAGLAQGMHQGGPVLYVRGESQ
jgi:hypothetical protein